MNTISGLVDKIENAQLTLAAKVDTSKVDTIRWTISIISFQTVAVIGAVVAIVTFVK